MDNREVERLSERLERVERDNRRLRRVGAVVVIGFASALLMAQARPNPVVKTVQAEEFIVRDSEGKARIKLGMSDKDPRLTFLDSQGKEVTGLSEGFLSLPSMLMLSNEYGGSLWITGKEGNKINLDVGSNGSAEFTMAGKKLSGEITLTVMPNGKANLSLKDNIAPRASLKLDTDGSPTLVFSDKDLKRRAWLNVRSDGRPELVLADANGGPRAWLMLQPDGGPVVGVQDKQGNIQTMPGEPTEVSAGGRTWILWGHSGGVTLPVGGWPTRNGCENERGSRTQAARDRAATENKDASMFFTCLPDNVDPRNPR